MTANDMQPDLTVIVPVFNEEQALPELRRRLLQVLDREEYSAEVIFVNDGSSDASATLLADFAGQDTRVKVVDLSRNFGHQSAMYAGLTKASGQAVILMDGDLQDPPEVIPELMKRWREGHEVVHAVRTKRKEGISRRAVYAAYYRILGWMAYIPVTLDSGDFSLMDRRVADLLKGMPECNKYLRGLRSWVGFRQTTVVYEREARYAGSSKYTWLSLVRLGLDGMISYSYLPLRLCYLLGFVVAGGSFLLALVYFVSKVFAHGVAPRGFATLAILILFLGGVQLLALGLLGEYIGRIYDEVKRRPAFIIRRTVGFGGDDEKEKP
jgi:dolichol-phosphate mannosyltransferase